MITHNSKTKRRSRLPSIKPEGPQRELTLICIGCGVVVTPPFYRTGKILRGTQFTKIQKIETSPIKVISSPPYLMGGIESEVDVTIGYPKYEKGLFCPDCCASHQMAERTNKDGSVERIPLIKFDPLPGTICRGALKVKGRIIRDGDRLSITSQDFEFNQRPSNKREGLLPSRGKLL